jgi:hypothetical protein
MLETQKLETMTMAEQQAMRAAIDRVLTTSAKVSQSLANSPEEQKRFNDAMKPMFDGLAEKGRALQESENRAVRTRTVEAQAEENARAAEITAAREASAGNALEAGRAQDIARQQHAMASGARGQAELAENAMRSAGATPRVREAAEQVVRSDSIRPDVAAQQAPTAPQPETPTPGHDNARGKGRKR